MYGIQHSTCNSLLNFCENRIIFINEGGEGFLTNEEAILKEDILKIEEALLKIEKDLLSFIEANKYLDNESLWRACLYYYDTQIKELKEFAPNDELLSHKLKLLEDSRMNMLAVIRRKVGYRKGAQLHQAIKRFKELKLVPNPIEVSSVQELKSLGLKREVPLERKYINNYFTKSSPEWLDLVRNKKESIEKMHDDCRVSLCIPAYNEELVIEKTLDVIFSQEFEDFNSFEVIICVNSEGELDNTAELVYKYAKDNNLPNLHCVVKKFEKGKGGVGMARKLATDIALSRSIDRNQSLPFYIASEDADLERYSHQNVLSNMFKRMDTFPYLDGSNLIHGKMPEIVKDNDILFLILRADNLFLLLSEREKNSPLQNKDFGFKYSRSVTLGSGAIFSASVLAQIGTYDVKKQYKGEDPQIGRLISILRGKERDGKFIPNTLTVDRMPSSDRVHTSPRRNIMELIEGGVTYGDEKVEKELRRYSNPELINILNQKIGKYISMENKNILEKTLSTFRMFFEENTGDNAEKLFARFIFMLGFKAQDIKVEKDENTYKVIIKNIENVLNSCSEYRKHFNENRQNLK